MMLSLKMADEKKTDFSYFPGQINAIEALTSEVKQKLMGYFDIGISTAPKGGLSLLNKPQLTATPGQPTHYYSWPANPLLLLASQPTTTPGQPTHYYS